MDRITLSCFSLNVLFHSEHFTVQKLKGLWRLLNMNVRPVLTCWKILFETCFYLDVLVSLRSFISKLVLSLLQVNSDKIYWQRNLDGTFSQIHSEKKAVGHCISTKAVGSDERVDITHLYKYPEGEKHTRQTLISVSRFACTHLKHMKYRQ